jgi:hypothetical protein
MNKEFIPYEQALELKELGLLTYKKDNDFGLLYKGSDIPSILYQQAFRWFREKYGIMYTVDNNIVGNTFHGSYTKINSDYESDYTDDFATYEEAELACLKKLIEIVKNERK